MKKLLLISLAVFLAISLAACVEDKPADSAPAVKSSLELLTAVWDSYTDDEKFPAAGGDMSEENMVMDGPGTFSTADASMLDTVLGLPEASAEKIDDSASLVHMMNANSFTCGVFHVKSTGDASDLSAAIKDNLMQRQWVCGFPDKLVIMQVDSYVVSIFGTGDIVDTFKLKLTETYTSAKTLCDEHIE